MNKSNIKSALKKYRILISMKYLICGVFDYFNSFLKSIYCIVHFNDRRLAINCDLTIGLKKLKNKRTTFPHPIGVVIGKGVEIGYDCKIYQCVTIGSKLKDGCSYPVIGNNVTIYANSVIVGDVTIGDNAIIGASTLIVKDVPENAIAMGNPAKLYYK